MVKVLFDFQYYISTSQADIEIRMPIENVPKKDDEVTFDFDLDEDIVMPFTIVARQFVYDKSGLSHIHIFLKNAES